MGYNFLKKIQRLTTKILITENQETGLRGISGRKSRVTKANSHSKDLATRYTTTKLLHTIYDGYRVPWTYLFKENFKNKLTHLHKIPADYRRNTKDIGGTIRFTNAVNNIRRGNKYILHKT